MATSLNSPRTSARSSWSWIIPFTAAQYCLLLIQMSKCNPSTLFALGLCIIRTTCTAACPSQTRLRLSPITSAITISMAFLPWVILLVNNHKRCPPGKLAKNGAMPSLAKINASLGGCWVHCSKLLMVAYNASTVVT